MTVLILGGGVMQLPAIRAAREKGWRVVLADGNPDCEGRDLADLFAHVDLVNLSGLEALGRDLAASGLDGVFTAGTDFSTSVAWVAEKCGLPGIAYAVARGATDKLIMRETFRKAGVPQPDFVGVEQEGEARAVIDRLGLPLVVKPVDNMGARGVRLVGGEAEMPGALRAALEASRSRRALAEQFMAGPELSLDALVWEGQATTCGVADRHIRFHPHFVEMGHTMPSAEKSELRDAAERVFHQAIRALGIERGAAKGDIKLTPAGPMVGEIAARLSGGYMSGWTYPHSSGVALTAEALEIAVGRPPGNLVPTAGRVSAERAFISIPGLVAGILGAEEARAISGVTEVFLRTAPGRRVALPTNNIEKCGNVITCAVDRAGAVEAARRAIGSILVRLSPSDPATEAFLRQREGPFRAFEPGGAAMETVERLPERVGRGAVGILPLSLRGIGEGSDDWHGQRLDEALAFTLRVTGAEVRSRGGLRLGRRFWEALLKGGAQAAVYVIDSERTRGGAA